MITEIQIEKQSQSLENADFEGELKLLSHTHKMLHSYLMNEQLEMLNEDEYKILWFDGMVIIKCFEEARGYQIEDDEKMIENLESKGWAMLENSKPAGFREKLDVFFENTRQEDLLAFVEDSLADDDEMTISSAAKEIIFITLYTLIEYLDNPKD